MNLLYCVSTNYLGLFVCSLRSVVTHGGYDHYDVHVFHSSFDEEMLSALRRDFGASVTFHFILVPDAVTKDLVKFDHRAKETDYRFLAPFLLPQELDRVLYLDADTIVINPLDELYEAAFGGNAIVGCTHTREWMARHNHARKESDKVVLRLNPGVLLMNLPFMRTHSSMEALIQCSQKKRPHFMTQEQFLLTALYGNKVKLLDPMRFNLSEQALSTYNCEHKQHPADLDWIRSNSVVIHYCGPDKPKREGYDGKLGVFYNELFAPRIPS